MGCYVTYPDVQLTASPSFTDFPDDYPSCLGPAYEAEYPRFCQQVELSITVGLPRCANGEDVDCFTSVRWGHGHWRYTRHRWANSVGEAQSPAFRWWPGDPECTEGPGSCDRFFLFGNVPHSGWMIVSNPLVAARVADADDPRGYRSVEYFPEAAVYIESPDRNKPDASFTVTEDVTKPGTFTFTDTSTDPDDDPLTVSWDVEGGATYAGSGFTHTFEKSGVYTVTQTVTDSTGRSDTAVRKVTVTLESFRYEMPPRFGVDDDEDGQLDYPTTADEVTPPDGFPVDLIVDGADDCAEADYVFTVGDDELDTDQEKCTFSTKLDEGSHEVVLSVDDVELGTETVEVDDVLIVAMGDSYSSGEGNPESSGAPWRDDKSQCHRSANAGPAKAALEAEEASDQTSVTFVHLACSGATIDDGLLGPQPFLSDPSGFDQLAAFDRLIERKVDALTMSVGANDVGFGSILSFCVATGDETDGCDAHYYDYVTVEESFDHLLVPGSRNPEPLTTGICNETKPGDTSISAAVATAPSERSLTETLLLLRDGRDWEVYLNPGGWDYEGSAETEDFRVDGQPTIQGGSFCERLATVGARIPLDDPVAQAFPRVLTSVPDTRPGGLLGLPQVQPAVPAVTILPPTLDDWVERRIDGLDDRFEALEAEINRRVDPDDVYLLEYMNPVTGSDGAACDNMLAPSSGTGVAKDEALWAWDYVLEPLNDEIQDSASEAGWNFVGGLENDFVGHGYCATSDRWVETLSESLTGQGDPFGAMHPNAKGHEAIGAKVFEALDGELDLTNGPQAPRDGRTVSTNLVEPAKVGDSVLKTSSDDGFAVGDTVVIDPGTDREEQGTIEGFGSIILTEGVRYPHDAGARVVRVAAAQQPPTTTTTTTSSSGGSTSTTVPPGSTTTSPTSGSAANGGTSGAGSSPSTRARGATPLRSSPTYTG